MTSSFSIVDAHLQESAQIAELHTRSWRWTYRRILPDSYLDGPLEQEMRERWAERMTRVGANDVVLLAKDDSSVIGMIAVWSKEGEVKNGWIDNLHVEPGFKRQGIGRALMSEAARRLMRTEHAMAELTVIEQNEAGIAFYERMGGEEAGRFVGPLRGFNVMQIRYQWHDLARLAQRWQPPASAAKGA